MLPRVVAYFAFGCSHLISNRFMLIVDDRKLPFSSQKGQERQEQPGGRGTGDRYVDQQASAEKCKLTACDPYLQICLVATLTLPSTSTLPRHFPTKITLFSTVGSPHISHSISFVYKPPNTNPSFVHRPMSGYWATAVTLWRSPGQPPRSWQARGWARALGAAPPWLRPAVVEATIAETRGGFSTL